MENNKKMWIVSSEPASTSFGSEQNSFNNYCFKEEVDIFKLKSMISEFSEDLNEIFDNVESKTSKFSIDTIELNATMAADGKLGILGSSIGAKVEGSIKFILKRK